MGILYGFLKKTTHRFSTQTIGKKVEANCLNVPSKSPKKQKPLEYNYFNLITAQNQDPELQ